MCTGCGACSAATNGAVSLRLGPTRLYEADISEASEPMRRLASRVCPFSDESPNEYELGAPRPSGSAVPDKYLGPYTNTYAGRVASEEYLAGSSSGGLTSWFLSELLKRGIVDAVISMVGKRAGTEHFVYDIEGQDDIEASRKSYYYASTMAEALSIARASSRKFAVVGVPCFIRAARALCRVEPEFDSRLVYFVSLVCGHYKTQAFAESLAWQVGVIPDDVAAVDFRVKRPGRRSSDYDFSAQSSESGEWRSAPVRTLVGGNWGHNAFQPEACNFCDDVVGETADVSFGDAWLPRYVEEPMGTNVVVTRNESADEILLQGGASGNLFLETIPASDVVASQAGGFRHRREGLAVRLADDLVAGKSVPRKRVSPNEADGVSDQRKNLIRQRRHIAAQSHVFFERAREKDDLEIYLKEMRSQIRVYRHIDMTPIERMRENAKRAVKPLIQFLRSLIGRKS